MNPVLRLFACVFVLGSLLGFAGCSKSTEVERWVAKGDKFYEEGDFEAAHQLYKQALNKENESPLVLSRFGRLALYQGRILSAYQLLNGTASKLPDDLDIQLAYALACHSFGRTAEARLTAKRIVERQPKNEVALILLVETCLTTRDVEETRRLVEQARTQAGDAAIFHVMVGMTAASQRDDAQAEKEFNEALKLDPKSAVAHVHLGKLQLRKGQKAAAVTSFQQAAGFSPLRSPVRMLYIDLLLQTGDETGAQRELDAILKKYNDYVPAWLVQMKLYFAHGKYDESYAATDTVISLDRANYEAWMQRVAIELQRKEIDKVINDLKRVEQYYTSSPDVKYKLALAYFGKDELFAADQYIIQALQLAPNYEDAILLKAEIDLSRGLTAPPILTLPKFIKQRPQSVRAYQLLAQAYRTAGEPEKSLGVLAVLQQGYPKAADAAYRVGAMQLELNRVPEARESFERALKLSDRFWPALETLVDLDLDEGQKAKADERINQALKAYPKAAGPWLIRAKSRLLANDVTGAESDLQEVITLDPKNSYAYLLLSRIYLSQGRLDDSAEKITSLTQRRPSPDALMQLGMLQLQQKQYDKAQTSFEKAIALDPKFAPALNNLAMLLAGTADQLERANDLAKRARAAAPEDPIIADTAGWIMVRRGLSETGLPLLQTAADRLSRDVEVRYHLGVAHYYLGHDEQARKILTEVATVKSFSALAEAEARLAILAVDLNRPTPEARQMLQRASQADPLDANALLRLAALNAREGDIKEAVAVYEKVLRLNPRDLRAITPLLDVYFGSQPNLDRGRELILAARQASPNDQRLAWRLGKLQFVTGDWFAANGTLQDASREFSDTPEFQFDFAWSQYSLGRIPETEAALAKVTSGPAATPATKMAAMLNATKEPGPSAADLSDADALLKTDPNNVPALMVKAAGSERANQPKEAQALYVKVISIYSQFMPAMRRLAVVAGDQLGDDAQADEWARKVLKLSAEDADANYQIGAVSFRKGDYAEAVRYLKQAIRRRDEQAEAHYLLGMAYVQLKNSSEAQIALQRAIELKLPPQEAGEAARQLTILSSGRNF